MRGRGTARLFCHRGRRGSREEESFLDRMYRIFQDLQDLDSDYWMLNSVFLTGFTPERPHRLGASLIH